MKLLEELEETGMVELNEFHFQEQEFAPNADKYAEQLTELEYGPGWRTNPDGHKLYKLAQEEYHGF